MSRGPRPASKRLAKRPRIATGVARLCGRRIEIGPRAAAGEEQPRGEGPDRSADSQPTETHEWPILGFCAGRCQVPADFGPQTRGPCAPVPLRLLGLPPLMNLLRRIWRLCQVLVPFGILVRNKPHHYLEMLRVAWENRRSLGYALRILRHGVCDGCSLGPRGLKDDVIPGVHLCLSRLKLLRLNTMGPIPDALLGNVQALRALSNEALHQLGRVLLPADQAAAASPASRGSPGTGDELRRRALAELETRIASASFLTSRGITNETYYTTQKLARIGGTPHVDTAPGSVTRRRPRGSRTRSASPRPRSRSRIGSARISS